MLNTLKKKKREIFSYIFCVSYPIHIVVFAFFLFAIPVFGSSYNVENTNSAKSSKSHDAPSLVKEIPKAKEQKGDEEKREIKNTSDLTFSESWARPSSKTSHNTAAYLTIKNSSSNDYILTQASNPSLSDKIELHNSFVDENGVSKMVKVDSIVIPKNSEIHFAPGGLHIMILNLKKDLFVGEKIRLDLTFKFDNDENHIHLQLGIPVEFEIKTVNKKVK